VCKHIEVLGQACQNKFSTMPKTHARMHSTDHSTLRRNPNRKGAQQRPKDYSNEHNKPLLLQAVVLCLRPSQAQEQSCFQFKSRCAEEISNVNSKSTSASQQHTQTVSNPHRNKEAQAAHGDSIDRQHEARFRNKRQRNRDTQTKQSFIDPLTSMPRSNSARTEQKRPARFVQRL
jgi:hypothetical protein